jgi:hypothetical protein
MVVLAQDGSFVVAASQQAAPAGEVVPRPGVLASEITVLPPAGAGSVEHGMALLVPIASGGSLIGAVLLGPKAAEQPYEDEDLMLLEDVADQLAAIVRTSRLQDENAQAINAMVSEFRARERALERAMQEMLAMGSVQAQPDLAGLSQEALVGQVEDALRRLHDYPALGEHSLARLAIVQEQLAGSPGGANTHIDRGKALNKVLVEAIRKLQPEGVPPNPHTVPPREWHQFIILYNSYVLDELNRDIMSRLYIGEGTFNRTRRRALQGVAKALQDMERATANQPTSRDQS